MNKIVFYISDGDKMIVRNCTSYRYKNNFCQIDDITLPIDDARGFFSDFNKRYKGIDLDTNDGTIGVSFEGISDIDIETIIKMSKRYKKIMNEDDRPEEDWRIDCQDDIFIRDEEDELAEKINRRKINRGNLFKKTIAIVTSATLLTMAAFAFSKKIDKDTTDNLVEDENTSISSPVIDDLIDPKDTIIIEDTTHPTPISSPLVTPLEEDTSFSDEELTNDRISGIFRLDTGNERDTDKYINMVDTYGDEVRKYAKMYGLDPELVMAIGTLERGVHSTEVDYNGGLGLFQIQVAGPWSWIGEKVRAYNILSGEYDEIIIDEDNVRDISNNIQVGCMILQNELVSANYNVAIAVTAYNYGSVNMNTVLRVCSTNTGIPMSELKQLANTSCWLDYRDCISGGDSTYLEDVFKYVEPNTILSFTKSNGEEVRIAYMNTELENIVNSSIKR